MNVIAELTAPIIDSELMKYEGYYACIGVRIMPLGHKCYDHTVRCRIKMSPMQNRITLLLDEKEHDFPTWQLNFVNVFCHPCGDKDCQSSTGIDDRDTYGKGNLSDNGFWEFPCTICTALEKKEYELKCSVFLLVRRQYWNNEIRHWNVVNVYRTYAAGLEGKTEAITKEEIPWDSRKDKNVENEYSESRMLTRIGNDVKLIEYELTRILPKE